VVTRSFFQNGLEMDYFVATNSLLKEAFYFNVDVAVAKLFDFAPS
jgi:hypothetical protein